MGLVADGAVLDEHVVPAGLHGDGVVTVVNDAVGYRDVGPVTSKPLVLKGKLPVVEKVSMMVSRIMILAN